MTSYTLRNPLENNFDKLIFKMIFDGVAHDDIAIESSQACRDFFANALNALDDPAVRFNMEELKKGLKFTLNWDNVLAFQMPIEWVSKKTGKKHKTVNIEVSAQAGFMDKYGDIGVVGDIGFEISPSGKLVKINWDRLD